MSKKIGVYISLYLRMVVAVLFFFSCSKTDEQLNETAQESSIDTYMNNYVTTENTKREKEIEDGKETDYYPEFLEMELKGGARVILLEASKEGSALFLERGDSVSFYFAAYLFSNGPSTLFATNDAGVAEDALVLDDMEFGAKKKLYDSDNLIRGLYDGLEGASEGDQLMIVFSSKYGYGNSSVTSVPKLSPLLYLVYIDKIIKNR